MKYLSCLHCQKPFLQPSRTQTCSKLCKTAVDKAAAKQRLSEDRELPAQRPAFNLTDIECLRIEAHIASTDELVFNPAESGFGIKDAHQETGSANANGVYDRWAAEGAKLDVWPIRRIDRARWGGIVLTAELAAQLEKVRSEIREDQLSRPLADGLDSPRFHEKTFAFEVDEAYERFLEET